jgi:hypothetical protein
MWNIFPLQRMALLLREENDLFNCLFPLDTIKKENDREKMRTM